MITGTSSFGNRTGFLGESFKDIFMTYQASGMKGVKNMFAATQGNIVTQMDYEMLQNFNQEVARGTPVIKAMQTTMIGASRGARTLAQNAGQAGVDINALTTATKSSRLAMIGMQAATMALNIGLSMGIGYIIQWVVSLRKEKKELKDLETEWQELSSTITTSANDFKTLKSSADSVIPKFAELAKGVDKFGRNVSLTDEEYKEFLSLNNQIAEMFPEINMGMDTNGNAMLALDLSAQTLTQSLWDLVEAERAVANESIAKTMPDVLSNITETIKAQKNSQKTIQEEKDNIQDAYNTYLSGIYRVSGNNYVNTDFYEALNKLSITWEEANKEYYGKDSELRYDMVFDTSESTKKIISQNYNNYIAGLDAQLQNFDNKISAEWKKLNSVVTAWLETDYNFQELPDDLQVAVKTMIGNLDFSNLGLTTEDAIKKHINNNIINPILAATPEVQQAFSDLLSIEAKDYDSITAYINEIDSKINKIASSDGDGGNFTVKGLKENLGYDKIIDDYQDKIYGIIPYLLEDELENGLRTNGIDIELDNANTILNWLTDDDIDYERTVDSEGRVHYARGLESTGNPVADWVIDTPVKPLDDYSINIDLTGIDYGGSTSWQDAFFAIEEIETKLLNLSPDELTKVFDSIEDYGINTWDKLEKALESGIFETDLDLSVETEGIEKLNSIINESVSATGLSTESITVLKSRYQDLAKFNPNELFEKTANGIRLNTKVLGELEQEYAKQQKTSLNKKLKGLIESYNDLSEEIEDCDDIAERANLYTQRNNVLNQINDVSNLATQYDGLTSSYKRWQDAQNNGEEGDMYDNIREGFKGAKELYDENLIGTEDFKTYVDLLSSKDLSSASVDEIVSTWNNLEKTIQGTSYSATDFLAEGKQGVDNFLYAVSQLNDEWASQNENGDWTINFGVGNDKEIADALGISEEFLQSMLMKLNDYGADINIDNIYSKLDLVQSEADAANQRLIDLGKTTVTFDFSGKDIETVTTQITKAEEMYEQFKDVDGKVDLEIAGAKEAQGILATLIYQKQLLDESAILKVDTSQANGGVTEIIKKCQDFKAAYNELEVQTKIGADTTEAQTTCDSLLKEISSMDATILADLGIDTTSVDNAITSIDAITVDAMIGVGLDASLIEGYQEEYTADGTVIWDNNIAAVTDWINESHTAYGTVIWDNDTTKIKTYFTGTGNIGWGAGKADGTAHLSGTAFAKGDWGTKDSGVALGGELGTELLVRNGKFFTIGDKSAEFFKYRKGDIIFNAEQTEQIFKYGKIISGNKRGNAYAEGTAFSSGTYKNYGSTNYNSSSKSNSSSSAKAENFEEIFDWIEIAIDRIVRAIDKLDLKVSSTYRSWESRNKNLKTEIEKVTEEISLQEKAYDRYIQEANSVGLDESWAKKVRDGTIDIETITNEDLADKVQKYQDWYEKALVCKDSIDELNESLGKLYETAFSNKQTEWEQVIGIVDHEQSMIEEFINQSEANGHVISAQYYQSLIDRENTNIDNLTQERDDLLLALKEGLESGAIEQGSETYYEILSSINEVTLGIEESNSSIIEFNNNIRDIEWEVFDLIQEKISNVTKEAEFLIDLMDEGELYNDQGQLTKTGLAVMGLHGQNYNVAMAQADKYAQEILNIDKQLAEDPYNQDLIERRQELLELQQDSILAAESEKLAIKDMVAEGINVELNALSELIDKYKESLDVQKDLYDYQKKIKDQTSEIASLQKQLTAYAGDTSEETKAKVQKLELSLAEAQEELQETQYDHFINDSKKMLDEMYTEYEDILNARLDDIDALMSDMIEVINDNSSSINQTLIDKTTDVGYTLSQEMSNIWNSSNGVNGILTTYGDSFSTQLTSVNVTLSAINLNVQNMIEQLNKIAGANISTVKDSNAFNSDEAKANKIEPPTPTQPTQPTQPETTETITIGGKINAGNAKIYSYAGGTGVSQYFTNDPIYTVLDEKNGYIAVRWHKLSSGQTGWFKKSDVKAYKNGIRSVSKDELAWTQEDGVEAIVRPSDGAILTPLKRDDGVMTHGETSNIFNMASNPSRFIRDNLFDNSGTDGVKTHSINNKTEVNFDNIHFVLPNVKNYDEFLYAMQHDSKFEQIVRAMTTDKIFGGSSFKKYRY